MTGHRSWAYDEITPQMRAAKPGLVLRAREGRNVIREWYCMPPVPGRRYWVRRASLAVEGADSVWRIYEYEEVADASQAQDRPGGEGRPRGPEAPAG